MPRFTWDGTTFDLVADKARWTILEVIAVQDHFGLQVEQLDSGRSMLANLWVSVHRIRPDFTLAQAGEVEYGAPQVVVEPPPPAPPATPEDPDPVEADGVVLTPTSGGGDSESATPPA